MASPTQWTWVWANSGRQRRTGRLGVLQSMSCPVKSHVWLFAWVAKIGHDLVTEQQKKANCRHLHDSEVWLLGYEVSTWDRGTEAQGGGRLHASETTKCCWVTAQQGWAPGMHTRQKEASKTALSKQSGLPLLWPKINVYWKDEWLVAPRKRVLPYT